MPADFVFKEGKFSPGPATFSHERHYAKIGTCLACHPRVFRLKKGADLITFATIKDGKFCGACHNGQTKIRGIVVFPAHNKKNCGRCHEE